MACKVVVEGFLGLIGFFGELQIEACIMLNKFFQLFDLSLTVKNDRITRLF